MTNWSLGGCMYFASTVTFTLHNCVLQDCLSPDSNSGGKQACNGGVVGT